MHKILVVLIILLSMSIPSQASAQEAAYDKAYNDYIIIQDQYKKSHEEYVVARANYLQSKTIASQTKAQEATAKMLQDRDQVLINYLGTVKLKLTETPGIENALHDTHNSLIDSEISWLTNHKTTLSASASLPELVQKSDEVKEKYKETELSVYKTLAQISNGKLNNFQSGHTSIISQLEVKVAEIKTNGDKDVTVIERRLTDVKAKIAESDGRESEAWTILDKIRPSTTEKRKHFNDSLNIFDKSFNNIKEANNLLKEIIISIKTQ